MDDYMNALTRIYDDIEARVRMIRNDHLDWPCRMGCDRCCRQLADVPRFTAAEWERLKEGLLALPKDRFLKVGQAIVLLTGQPSSPIVCPILDQSTGACLVYDHRPAVCRTYGFYVQRGQGLYCKDIESRDAGGDPGDIVWGNQDAIDRRLSGLGETRELTHWFMQEDMR
jgi:uncharacterized protein